MSVRSQMFQMQRALTRVAARGAMTALAAIFLSWTAACSDSDPVEPPHQHVVSALQFEQPVLAIRAGNQATLALSARCHCGATMTVAPTWTSSDPLVAAVTNAGVVTGVAFGEAAITASVGNIAATVAVQVAPRGTVVGSAGGAVVSEDGKVTVTIPAGALVAPTDITVSAADDAPFRSDALYVGGTAYAVEPATVTLRERARIRIAYNPAAVPAGIQPEQLRVRERVLTQWREHENRGLQGQAVEAAIDRFGVFAIVVKPVVGTLIGQTGGTVVSSDGAVELQIPAFGLNGLSDVVITKADDGAFGGDPLYLAGTGYRIEAEALVPGTPASGPFAAGVQLNVRARLRIRYDPARLPVGVYPEQLRIRLRDQDQWRDCDHDGLQQSFVQAWTQELGLVGLVIRPPAGVLIGPLGGTAVSADGRFELTIPASALDAVTDIVITKAADAAFGTEPRYLPGSGYQVEPAGTALKARARLRVRYDPAGLPTGTFAEQLRIRERDRDQWHDCNHDGLQQQFVVAWSERLGLFGLIVQPPVGTMIGPLGGAAVSADGLARLIVPAGAVTTPTDIIIVPANPAAFATDPLYVPGTAYQILPDPMTFGAAVRLRINFDPNKVPPTLAQDKLRIRERDRTQDRWRDCTHVGIVQTLVEATILRSGVYAILGQQAAVATITVSPATLTLLEGDLVQATADVRDAAGNPVSTAVTWSSDNPAVATVSPSGLVTALTEGSATIAATAGGVVGRAPVSVKAKPRPATIAVTPTTASIAIGGTVQLTADVRDAAGNPFVGTVTWSSSATGVATVSATGLVTGVAAGPAQITARIQNLTATADITVLPPVASVAIAAIGSEPLEIGLTVQLSATAYNAAGQPIPAVIVWSTSDPAIAVVDQTGLVKGTGRGTATITAAVGSVNDQVDIRVVGESVETGNNMSWPTVFAEGIGLTGLAVATDPGVRPTPAEGITVDVLPFFWSGNVPTTAGYYEQQTFNTWRAMWIDGTGQSPYDAQAYWGDNITAKEWSAARPIRVEIALSATGVGTLTGYNMTYLRGEGPTEMQGTDGTTGAFIPLIYTVAPTITVEKLDAKGGNVVSTFFDGEIKAEVNVGGRIVYGYQLNLATSGTGWYRLRFRTAATANLALKSVGNTSGTFLPVIVDPRETMIEIHVTP